MNNALEIEQQENEVWQNIAKVQAKRITELEEQLVSFQELFSKALAGGQETRNLAGEPVLVIRKSDFNINQEVKGN